MDFRSMLDQVKQAFVIGKNNPFLHGRQGRQAEEPAYEPSGWQQPQAQFAPPPQEPYAPQAYQQPYQQPYQPQQDPWQQAAPQQAPYAQQPGAYQAPYQPPQQAAYQAPQQPQMMQQPYEAPQPEAPPQHQFQSQFNPEPQRNRRAQQHQPQPQAAPQAPAPVKENLVPFPGAQVQEFKQTDAYVINVFNINSCRQAMSCLRKGQCTLIVMDQLADKAEIRRYVDMLTGACYALGGTMTRLSAKIGFYIMAPSGMTVYTDPTTTNANQQPRPQAQPLYRADTTPGAPPTRSGYEFAPQGAYAAVPQVQFAAHQAQPQQAVSPQEHSQQEPQQSAYNPWQEQQPYAANN